MSNQITMLKRQQKATIPVSYDTKLRRRIEDYLRKYATPEQLNVIGTILQIKSDQTDLEKENVASSLCSMLASLPGSEANARDLFDIYSDGIECLID